MPFLRPRHDGTLVLSASSPSITRSASLLQPVRLSIVLLGALSVPVVSTAWAHPEKVVGVRAWTSGSQTYIRARPSASTPPVAKVDRHTPLYVWGKFDGWYRVETHDHIFGWVHNEYISSPGIAKVRELSHYKALQASKLSSEQTMYGTPTQLKAYYAKYGGKGALRGLKEHGIHVATAPVAKPNRVVVAARPLAPVVRPLQKRTTPVEPVAPATQPSLARESAPSEVSAVASNPSTDSQTPATPSRLSALRAGMLAKLPEGEAPGNLRSATPPVVSAAQTGSPSAVVASPPVVLTPVAPRKTAATSKAVPVAKPVVAKANAHSANAAAARAAAAKSARANAYQLHLARAAAKAKKQEEARLAWIKRRDARIAKWKNQQAWKQNQLAWQKKQHELRVANQQSRRQMRLASRAKQRQMLGARVGLLPKGRPPVSLQAGQVAPLSPEDLMKARASYLESRNRRWSAEEGGLAPVGSVAPLPNSTSPFAPAPAGNLAPAQPGHFTPSAFHRGAKVGIDGSVVFASQSGNAPYSPVLLGTAPLNPSLLASRGGVRQGASLILASDARGGSPRDRFAAGNAAGEKMAVKALSYRGMPYIFGASSPRRGFDCSGLVYFLLRQRGYNPPRTAAGYRNYGQSVERGHWQPGDLILFSNTYKRGISHIGVYLGNNKFVHAATAGRGVRVDSLNGGYYANKYWGARRVK